MRRHTHQRVSFWHRMLTGRVLPVVLACLPTMVGMPIHAAVVLPDTPLQVGTRVPPNIRFILDDSGSMRWAFMPGPFDNREFKGTGSQVTSVTNISQEAYTRNTLYYNPYVTYRPWRLADGSFMTPPVAPQVYTDPVYVGGATANFLNGLSDSGGNGIAFNPRFHVPQSASSNLSVGSDYYRYEFTSATTAQRCTWNGSNWTTACVAVTSFPWTATLNRTVAEELQNFANWYSYHRTRTKAAKAGAGYAFGELSENMRVGFDTIWNRSPFDIPVGSDNGLFRDLGGSTNRSTWYDRLYNAQAVNGTPLHSALDRAGRYFQDTSASGPWGPETGADQLTCRQNFSILTTDGFWNANQSGGNEDNAPGPVHTSPDGATYQYTPAPPFSDGNTGTLADMAMKYWKNDLRSDMVNNVPTSGDDPAFWQHMVTFGLSIGLRGTLDPKADLPALTAGTKVWPNPIPTENLTRVDDLWHAAVNGHGEFVAASSPDEFTKGLKDALAAITSRTSASSNVTVNGVRVGSGTQVFQGSFISGKWTGELKAFPVTTAGIGATPNWSASTLIPAAAARKIYTYNGSSGSVFNWAGLSAAQQTALGGATVGPDVLDYLRGDDSKETKKNVPGATFRDRTTVLGDIDHSSPVYVDIDPDGNPATNDGSKTVYAGANDGMLHAFDAATGVEQFAYVPGGIDFAKLKTLTSVDYPHSYFVDGEIVVSNRQQTPGKNILVGLLGRGGKTVYALDVSDPSTFNASRVLWEFSDPDLGNALGEPIITKLNNGKTGVIIGNGYNSVNERAVLFILDIQTGAVIKKFDTLAGNAAGASNGMAAPRGWDANRSGTLDFLYAGDLLGNVWKMDIQSSSTLSWTFSVTSGGNPAPIFVAKDTLGNRQPITGGMAIGLNPVTFERWIFFGTGRYLTNGDPADRSKQSWYGLLDAGIDTTAEVLDRSLLKGRSIVITTSSNGEKVRAFEAAVGGDMIGKKGWVVDLETPTDSAEGGERIVSRSVLSSNVLLASSIIPSSNACNTAGRGYVNFIDPYSGGSIGFYDKDGDGNPDTVNGHPVGSVDLGVGMPTMPTVIGNGPGEGLLIVGGSLGGVPESRKVLLPSSFGRISWREVQRE